MPGSHSKKDKLKKRIAKIKKKKPFMQRKIEEGDKFFFDKKTGTLSSINESTKEYQDFKAETLSNAEKIKTQRKKRRSVGTAKMRKADQQDINRVKRWNSRTFNKKKELSGPTEPVFKPTANLRNRLAKVRKADGGVAPNYNNPSKVRKKKTTTKAASLGALGWGKLDRKTGKPQKLKPRKKTLDDYPTEKAKLAAGVKNIGNKPWMEKKEIDKSIRPSDMSPEERKQRSYHIRNRLKNKKQKTALRSAVNKGVNKVNPIKPTKTYKKPPQGPNPYADTPDEIMKNAEVAGRKNDTYIGKIKKKNSKN